MSELTTGGAAAEEPGPTITELLTMAADVVAMVHGQVSWVGVGHGILSVRANTQPTAEYLAWRLALGRVADYEPTPTSEGFAVWSGGAWPEPEFKVFCGGELVRPLRAFPRSDQYKEPAPKALPGAA
ncbi:hypothetical protein CTKZ_21230 [Cellulomonas algicola]|uniref:Uncharacterized protein n=1 Tax=Cellulomonas algicola TaxID=2071633 RepID=A0A401V0X2_9CELL|nr:hypothetical protein [Cellulomonas algicola]GCD20561.1 hypothetical protein CTKZ_21230 [Cellulomonas algicola]